MSGFRAVFQRELRSYFATPLAYVFLVFFLVVSSLWTFIDGFFEIRQASLRLFFTHMPVILVGLAPAIAMRLWAEERRTNTIEMLFTLPVTATQAVLAKFLAAWSVVLLALALTCPMALTVCYLGRPDPGPIIAGYAATFLLAGAYLAIGGFFSSLTRNQVIAFVMGMAFCGLFLIAGSPTGLNYLRGLFSSDKLKTANQVTEMISQLSVMTRFDSLQRGVIGLGDAAFFVLLIAGWLWATVVAIEERRAAG